MMDSKRCELCCDRLGEFSDGALWLTPPDAFKYWCKGCVNEVALEESIEEYPAGVYARGAIVSLKAHASTFSAEATMPLYEMHKVGFDGDNGVVCANIDRDNDGPYRQRRTGEAVVRRKK